jgi:pimeloyl-ACP methyl ester carboxylesterase
MRYQVVEVNEKVNERDVARLMVFITGAGIGPFMWTHQIDYFEAYKKIMFNLPGHGDNYDVDFTTIEAVASALRQIILKESFDGKAIIIGHSIGAQILMWMMQNMRDVVYKGVIVSGLNKPMKGVDWLIKPAIYCSMPLIKYKRFARLQSKELSLPDSMFEQYYKDSLLISPVTLTNILKENMSYSFVGNCGVEGIVIVGDAEKNIMKQSAKITAEVLGNKGYYNIQNAAHGIPYEKPEVMNQLITLFLTGELESETVDGVKFVSVV